MNESGRGRESNLEPFLAGSQPEAEGNVSLAGATRAESDDVLAPIGELAAGQFCRQRLVDRRDRLEVETVEAFGGRELRGLDPAFDHPAFPLDQLQLAEP